MKLLSIYLIPVFIYISIPGLPMPFVFEVKTPIGFATPAPATPNPGETGVKTPIGVRGTPAPGI